MRYLIVLLLAGCATTKLVDIDYSITPPADWPRLQERLTYGPVADVQRWCRMPAAIRDKAFNCAVVRFDLGLCMIYLSTNDAAALTHEQAHCRGYSHIGDGYKSHRAWEQYKKTRGAGALTQ